MARAPDPKIEQAKKLYKKGVSLVEIAKKLDVPAGTVRRWKSTHDWDGKRSESKNERSGKKTNVRQRKANGSKSGKGNRFAKGGPVGNQYALKHGMYSKYFPKETLEIFEAIENSDPLDLLWDQIVISYAAIVRAQRINYVRCQEDQEDREAGSIMHNSFLTAQARAQAELRNMIKQYDEMLHSNWDLATEEQRVRIDTMKARAQIGEKEEIADDGFLEALKGSAGEDWEDEDQG